MIRNLLLATTALAAMSWTGQISGGETGFREGQFFPDLRLPDLKGGKVTTVSAFRGKKTLLLVFASW